MKEISSIGDCVCNTGFRTIEIDKLGNYLTSLQCELCPDDNGYQGIAGRSVWECQTCPDPAMVFVGEKCTCPTEGYVTSGDACITDADITRLREDGFLADGLEYKVYYNNLVRVDDQSAPGENVAPDSDVFKEFYL